MTLTRPAAAGLPASQRYVIFARDTYAIPARDTYAAGGPLRFPGQCAMRQLCSSTSSVLRQPSAVRRMRWW